MYNSLTTDFYEKDNLEVRKENGIYITPYNIIKKCFDNEDISKYKDILEPSFGTGQCIDVLIDLIKNKKGKSIVLIQDIPIFINVLFPDDVWKHIKQFLFDPAITNLMNKITDLEERKIIYKAEWDLMTYQSQEWNFQKDILWSNCQLIGVYQRKIKHLLKKDRPRHTLIN